MIQKIIILKKMDEDIIATLIQENDMLRVNQAELQKTADDLRVYSEELLKNNEKMRQYSKQLRSKLIEEEEMSQVLSKRIEILEKEMYDVKIDFRSYVEKMQIYLQTEYVGIVKEERPQEIFARLPSIKKSITAEGSERVMSAKRRPGIKTVPVSITSAFRFALALTSASLPESVKPDFSATKCIPVNSG